MAPPSKTFTIIPDSAIDPDSPLTTTLMTNLRDNDIHLEEWLGKNFVAAIDHDHDGVNSANVAGNNLRFIETIEVSGAAVASITFSSLDGNADKRYLVYGTIIRGIAGTVVDYQLRFNAIAAGYQGTPAGLSTGIQVFSTILNTEAQTSVRFKADIHVHTLIQSVDTLAPSARVEAQKVNILPAAGFTAEQEDGGLTVISAPVPNITSLSFHAATAGTVFAIGSRISLFKIEEN